MNYALELNLLNQIEEINCNYSQNTLAEHAVPIYSPSHQMGDSCSSISSLVNFIEQLSAEDSNLGFFYVSW